MGRPRELLETQRQAVSPSTGMYLGREHTRCLCRRQLQPGCFSRFEQRRALGAQAHPASPKSGLTPHPLRQRWLVGDRALQPSPPHLTSAPTRLSSPGKATTGRKMAFFSSEPDGVHQGGDAAADILASYVPAARGTEAFALGNTSQPPWSGQMTPWLGKACPQERLLSFPDAGPEMLWQAGSASLQAADLGVAAGARHRRGSFWQSERSSPLLGKACRERGDWRAKGKSEQGGRCRGWGKGWKCHGAAAAREQLCRQERKEHPLMHPLVLFLRDDSR